jgi:hypothetical protein
MEKEIGRKRTKRIRKLAAKGLFGATDANAEIKWADTDNEYIQSFRLLYDRYVSLDYIKPSKSFPLYYNIFSLLPNTKKVVMKMDGRVVSTVDIIMDHEKYKLPMHVLYSYEIEALREQGRRVCEIGALACLKGESLRNAFMPLFRIVCWQALNSGIHDVCLMVNPKHVAFYKNVIVCETLGDEKFYPAVNAPAVALRIKVDTYERDLMDAYKGFPCQNSLYSYFFRWQATCNASETDMITSNRHTPMADHLLTYLASNQQRIAQEFSQACLLQ